ncbi:AraC family transcriptional regulator [Brevibacillus reuszeri]|uniref:AraC family transcriptional regulator n=1 Tax=Brevibacillus reuszeri TaxID=54915 RepID=UPI00289BBA5D|nr:AraC family transcriptional regulator [Brevibacillus reuszeri]
MIDLNKLAENYANGSFEIEEVYRLVIQPKSTFRECKTEKYGFLFIIRGEARMRVNGIVYELRPGSVFHAAPNMLMDAQVMSATEYEYFALFYKWDESVDEKSGRECDAHFKLEPAANPRLLSLLTMLLQNSHPRDWIGKLRVKELFFRILHQVLIGCSHRESDHSPSKMVIEEAVVYIHGHYMHPFTLDDLAEQYGMTTKRFSYFFHKYTGFRPIDYVIHYRMEKAQELLRTGNYPVSDVAVSVGYPNALYFSRVFKKKFGVAPSAFANQEEHS